MTFFVKLHVDDCIEQWRRQITLNNRNWRYFWPSSINGGRTLPDFNFLEHSDSFCGLFNSIWFIQIKWPAEFSTVDGRTMVQAIRLTMTMKFNALTMHCIVCKCNGSWTNVHCGMISDFDSRRIDSIYIQIYIPRIFAYIFHAYWLC